MTLRIMLLGLVASMGFELPSGSDISRWAESAQCWVDATKADRSDRCGEALKAEVVSTECLLAGSQSCHSSVAVEQPKACEDKAFDAVADTMAAEFAADLVGQGSEPMTLEPLPSIVAVLEVPATGLPRGEEVATAEVVAEKVEVAEVIEEPAMTEDARDLTTAMHERLDRIASAVRLTREAVQAWAEVIEPADETGLTR